MHTPFPFVSKVQLWPWGQTQFRVPPQPSSKLPHVPCSHAAEFCPQSYGVQQDPLKHF